MGLWAHQFRGFDKDPVADALGVPAYWRILAGIAVGVRGNPAEVPSATRSGSTGCAPQAARRDRVRRLVGRAVGRRPR